MSFPSKIQDSTTFKSLDPGLVVEVKSFKRNFIVYSDIGARVKVLKNNKLYKNAYIEIINTYSIPVEADGSPPSPDPSIQPESPVSNKTILVPVFEFPSACSPCSSLSNKEWGFGLSAKLDPSRANIPFTDQSFFFPFGTFSDMITIESVKTWARVTINGVSTIYETAAGSQEEEFRSGIREFSVKTILFEKKRVRPPYSLKKVLFVHPEKGTIKGHLYHLVYSQ